MKVTRGWLGSVGVLWLGACASPAAIEAKDSRTTEAAPTADEGDVLAATAEPTNAVPVEAAAIEGRAYMPREQLAAMSPRASGHATTVSAGAAADNRKRWTLEVTEASGKVHTYLVELPQAVVMPVSVGASVLVRAGATGGGPNRVGTIVVTEAGGGLLLAVNELPDSWRADRGAALGVDKGSTYDAHSYAVTIHASKSKGTVTAGWSKVTLDGDSFYGTGTAVERKLHQAPPPDYVGGWIDFTLIRVGAK